MTSKTISSWVSGEVAEKLDAYASHIGMSRSDTIRIIIEQHLRKKVKR